MRKGYGSLPDWVWANTGSATLVNLMSQFTLTQATSSPAIVATFDATTGAYSGRRSTANNQNGVISPLLELDHTYRITFSVNSSAGSGTYLRQNTISGTVLATVAVGASLTQEFTVTSSWTAYYVALGGVTNNTSTSGIITGLWDIT